MVNESVVPIYDGIFLNVEKKSTIDFSVIWMEPEKIGLNVLFFSTLKNIPSYIDTTVSLTIHQFKDIYVVSVSYCEENSNVHS